MRITGLLAIAIVCTDSIAAQQLPFIPVTGPNAPKGASVLFEDRRGGMWLGGFEGWSGLRYFDGTRFTDPVSGNFPKLWIIDLTEDSDGGIWIASLEGLYRVFHGNLNLIARQREYKRRHQHSSRRFAGKYGG